MANLADFMASEGLPPRFLLAVEQIHVPLAQAIARRCKKGAGLVVGIAGPQGSGKSTGTAILRRLLEADGLRVAALSLDDLYLGRDARLALASAVHPLLKTRGPPGTHDVDMGQALLAGLTAGDSVLLPVFDKASDDRRPRSEWQRFDGSADVVLFEGWCVGARPQTVDELRDPVNALERDRDPDGVWRRYVNASLERYQQMFARLHMLIQIRAPAFERVLDWRREQEAKLRATSGSARRVMSHDEVAIFIQHYERISRHMDREMAGRADAVIELGDSRELVRMALR